MKHIKKTISTVARLLIGLAIIFYIFNKIDTPEFNSVLSGTIAHWRWLIGAVLLIFFCLVIGAVRWKLILDAQDLRMSWLRTICVYFIGHFFNSFMFGATGGDITRAYYTVKETHHKKTEAVATIIIDRVIGMLALFVIAGVMLVWRLDFYLARTETRIAALLMSGMILTGVLCVVTIFNAHRFKGFFLFKQIAKYPKIETSIRRTAAAFDLYRRRTSVLINTSLLSFANHGCIVLMCYCLGRSLQVHMSILDYFTVIPVIMSLAAIPITPGGLGVREGLTVTMLGAMNVSKEQALPLSLMVYALMLIWSIIGGVVFLCYSASSGCSLHDQMAELREESESENG